MTQLLYNLTPFMNLKQSDYHSTGFLHKFLLLCTTIIWCGCCDVTCKQIGLKAQCKQGISVDWLLKGC